jgi:acyl-CoA hydrolase
MIAARCDSYEVEFLVESQGLFYFSNKEIRVSETDFTNFESRADFETRIVEMVFPNQTNHYGTLFGGHALELMDKSAFITASRYARKSMVTACSEKIDFKAPVKNGQLVEVIGRIVKRGNSSVTVGVQLFAEDLLSGERQICAEGHFVLVAVDGDNKPIHLDKSSVSAQSTVR